MQIKINEIGLVTRLLSNKTAIFLGQVAEVGNSVIFNPSEEGRKTLGLYGKDFGKSGLTNQMITTWICGFQAEYQSKTFPGDANTWITSVIFKIPSRKDKVAIKTKEWQDEPSWDEISAFILVEGKQFKIDSLLD